MQKISITTHRGRPCFRYFVGRRARYKVIKHPENPEPERIQLMAELLNGPKEKKSPKPKSATLDETIDLYEIELLAELGKHRFFYCGQVAYRVRRVLAGAKITRLQAITASKIKVCIADMRKPCRKPKAKQKPTDLPQNPLSEQSRIGYLQAIKQFCRWCVKTGRLDSNPVAELKKRKVRVRPHKRDRLQADELATLIQHTRQSSRIIESLDGEDRTLLYLLAACTGLRKSELGSLTPACFALGEQPQLTVASAYTKNADPAVLPLHASVLPLVRQKLVGLDPGDLLWPGLAGGAGKDAAKMLQADMRDCGLPIRTEHGIRAFHSLRNSFISGLFDAGVDVACVQKLARHADPTMTLSYARLRPDGERLAIAKLTIPGL